jgi:P-type E1-E2 ATPase
MIELNIPGRGSFRLNFLVCDVNGTLAVDGKLIEGLAHRIHSLRDRLEVHLITANTHGSQELIDQQLNLRAVRLRVGNEALQKGEFVRSLGAEHVIAIGQGANDAQMLAAAAIGIAIVSPEGLALTTLQAADLVVADIFTALDLLDKPLRLVASLRQ